jgi:hypothetical protein
MISKRSALTFGFGVSQAVDTKGTRPVGYSWYYPSIGYEYRIVNHISLGLDLYSNFYFTTQAQSAHYQKILPWFGISIIWLF